MRAIVRAHPGQSVAVVAFQCWLLLAGTGLADPCGMVPPIYIQDNTSLVRVGDQQTYVFYKDGIETFVIRPGFSGKVEELWHADLLPHAAGLAQGLGRYLPADRRGD